MSVSTRFYGKSPCLSTSVTMVKYIGLSSHAVLTKLKKKKKPNGKCILCSWLLLWAEQRERGCSQETAFFFCHHLPLVIFLISLSSPRFTFSCVNHLIFRCKIPVQYNTKLWLQFQVSLLLGPQRSWSGICSGFQEWILSLGNLLGASRWNLKLPSRWRAGKDQKRGRPLQIGRWQV